MDLWLPLTQDTRQQGLSNASVTAVGSGASINANGKLGKCYYLDGTSNGYISTDFPTNFGTNDFTISLWVKIPTISSGSYYAIVSSKQSAAISAGVGIYWNYSQKRFLWSTADRTNATEIWMADAVDTIVYDKWIHLVMVRDNNDAKHGCFYINGTRYELASVPTIRNITTATNLWVGKLSDGHYPCKLYISDIKVWNGKALSPREIEILSRGLVCHYPLCDVSNQTPNNVAAYPTFDTSSGHGGWNHWGNTGNLGHYSQNTNAQYIFRSGQTYSHCFSDESTATAPYLLYQSPSFSGGYRSLCAIIKEENGAEIKESIVYPVWNAAVSGSIPSGKWTSITPLGNGFYLGKVEGFQQDGSNNLVGIYVNAGYKIYVSEFYIENDRTVCSDFFYPSTTVYDTSGYQYNGTINGSLTVSSDTARYSVSTKFSGNATDYIVAPSLPTETKTVSCWIKCTLGNKVAFADYNTNIGLGLYGNDKIISYVGSSNGGTGSCVAIGSNWKSDKWNHVVIEVTNNNGRDVYLNGVKLSPESNDYWTHTLNELEIGRRSYASYCFDGYISDFRAYATALSAAQVAELYNTAVSVANNGTLIGYELVEG